MMRYAKRALGEFPAIESKTIRDLDVSCNQIECLPASVGSLLYLVRFNCARNRLRSVPQAIGQLHALRELDVSENQIKSLPDTIGSLSNLRILDASHNRLQTVPTDLHRLAFLRRLVLIGNPLTGAVSRALSQGVLVLQAHLKALKDLNLHPMDTLSPQDTIRIEQKQTFLHSELVLEAVDVSLKDAQVTNFANLSSLGLKELKKAHFEMHTCNRPNLKSLVLSQNHLVRLPQELWSWSCMAHLRALHLSFNRLERLPSDIDKLQTLVLLNVSNNRLTHLPRSLSNLKCLKFLDVSSNQLDEIPIEIQCMPHLESLAAGRNRNDVNQSRRAKRSAEKPAVPELALTQALCATLQRHAAVSSMTLYNDLVPADGFERVTFCRPNANLEAFPAHLTTMTQLRLIDLSNNRLEAIPSTLHRLVHLRRLVLRHNKISCRGVPIELAQCNALQVIDLAHNRLVALTPFVKVQSLRRLDVSFNQIEGDNLLILKQLESIVLVGNTSVSPILISALRKK